MSILRAHAHAIFDLVWLLSFYFYSPLVHRF